MNSTTLFGVFFVSVVLSIVVGCVAYVMNRNFWHYFALSVLLSPLVGFIVLIVKGKATQDELLRESSHVYYCNRCNDILCKSGSQVTSCPRCGQLLNETIILTKYWNSYDFNRRESLKREFANGLHLRGNIVVDNIAPATIVNAASNSITEEIIKPDSPPSIPSSDVDEIRKYKELLDEGAITQEEYDKKKKKILKI